MGMGHGRHRPARSSELETLAGTYFHADVDLDFPEPLDVVRQFIADSDDAVIGRLCVEISDLVRDPVGREERLRTTWLHAYRSYYDPRDDGMSFSEWFTRVLELAQSAGGPR